MLAARSAPADPTAPRAPLRDKFYYGVGQFGEGLQASSGPILMFFYTQVVGVDPVIAGVCLLVANIISGVLDALAGAWSDATRHRWGRRHPYIYYSSIPASLSMALLFMPPSMLGETGTIIWLFVWAIVLRAALALYLIPHWALGVELSDHPKDRIDFVTSRIFFSFLGSGSLFLISALFFRKGGASTGVLDPAPYLYLALFIGVVALITKVGSGLGTHKYIPRLPQPTVGAPGVTIAATLVELKGLFRNRAFVVFFFGALMVSLGLSVRVLDIYMGAYFWKLPPGLVFILPGLSISAFATGTFFWGAIAKVIGKKTAYITGIGGSGLILALLPALKIAGLFPAEGSSLYFPTILGLAMLGNLSAAAGGVMAGSFLADVSDDYQRQTGRKAAGIITGLLMFNAMLGAAVAQAVAGVLIKWIGLTPGLPADSLPVEITNRLGYTYGLTAFCAAAAFVTVFSLFPRMPRETGKV